MSNPRALLFFLRAKFRHRRCHRCCRLVSHVKHRHEIAYETVLTTQDAYEDDPCLDGWHEVCLWNWLHKPHKYTPDMCEKCLEIFRWPAELHGHEVSEGQVYCLICGRFSCLGPCVLRRWLGIPISGYDRSKNLTKCKDGPCYIHQDYKPRWLRISRKVWRQMICASDDAHLPDGSDRPDDESLRSDTSSAMLREQEGHRQMI